MRKARLVTIIGLAVSLTSCSRSRDDLTERNQNERDRKSAAFKVGELTHGLSKEVGKAAKAAGRELGKESHQAREGWDHAQEQEQRNDRVKKKQTDR